MIGKPVIRLLFLALAVWEPMVWGSCFADEVQQQEQRRIAAIAESLPATVCIFGPGGQGGGSGVVISSDGFALTNYHVVESCDAFMKCSMPDGVLYDAVIVGIDPTGDVALIKLCGRENFPVAKIGDSDLTRVGDECFAVGNPFLLATDFQPSVSWGIVSGVNRYQYPSGTLLEYADCIQTDAAINPGNSGGPLFDADGNLIGINGRGSFEKRGRVNVGVGYAISVNQIKNFVDQLKSGRIVDHATIGAIVSTDLDGKPRFANILASSDTARRGIDIGDQVLSFGGREIQTVNQFKSVLGIYPKGWRLPITVGKPDGTEFETIVRLTGVHASEQLIEQVQGKTTDDLDDPDRPGEDSEKNQPVPGDPDNRLGDEPAGNLVPGQCHGLYQHRRGYANYYFNQFYRDQVWQRFVGNGNFTLQRFNWRIKGTLNGQTPVTIVLTDNQSGMQVGRENYVLDPDSDLASQLVPPKSGGLLVTLHLWRQLLVSGPDGFGEVIYFGSLPDAHRETRSEVLVATTQSIESNFLFDPDDGLLLGIEMFPELDSDACEVRFLDFQIDNELTVPSEIRFLTGNSEISVIRIDQIEFLKE